MGKIICLLFSAVLFVSCNYKKDYDEELRKVLYDSLVITDFSNYNISTDYGDKWDFWWPVDTTGNIVQDSQNIKILKKSMYGEMRIEYVDTDLVYSEGDALKIKAKLDLMDKTGNICWGYKIRAGGKSKTLDVDAIMKANFLSFYVKTITEFSIIDISLKDSTETETNNEQETNPKVFATIYKSKEPEFIMQDGSIPLIKYERLSGNIDKISIPIDYLVKTTSQRRVNLNYLNYIIFAFTPRKAKINYQFYLDHISFEN